MLYCNYEFNLTLQYHVNGICTVRLSWAGHNLSNEMNFGMNHASGGGLIARPVDLQSSKLPVCYDCLSVQDHICTSLKTS